MFSRSMIWQHVAAAVVAIVIAGMVSWSTFPPFEVLSSKVITAEVPRGGNIVVQRNVRWLRWGCTVAYLSAELTDSLGYHDIMDTRIVGRRVTAETFKREWPVPFSIPMGETVLRVSVATYCPPFFSLHPTVVDLPKVKFMAL